MTDEERIWHADKCERYLKEYPVYEAYSALMNKLLRTACAAQGIAAIVQVRPKDFSSFADKMARKAEGYMRQNRGPGDSCGPMVSPSPWARERISPARTQQ